MQSSSPQWYELAGMLILRDPSLAMPRISSPKRSLNQELGPRMPDGLSEIIWFQLYGNTLRQWMKIEFRVCL